MTVDTIELFKTAFAEKKPEQQPVVEPVKYGADVRQRDALFSYAFGEATHAATTTAAEAAKADLDWRAVETAPIEVLAHLQEAHDAGTSFMDLPDELQAYVKPDNRARAAMRAREKELAAEGKSIDQGKAEERARLAAESKLQALAALAQKHPNLGSVQALFALEKADFESKFGAFEQPELAAVEDQGDTAADGIATEAAVAVDADDAGGPAGADETAAGSDN